MSPDVNSRAAIDRRGAADRRIEVLRRLAEASRRGESRPAFLDGLVLGAMVGAALAGSALWSRWRERHRRPPGPSARAS